MDGIPGMGILKTLGSIAEGTIDLIIGVFDALGSALLIGKTAIDSTKNWLKTYRGDEARKDLIRCLEHLKTSSTHL